MIDHGMLNLPLAKRGCIDAQIDAYKAQKARNAKAEAKALHEARQQARALAPMAPPQSVIHQIIQEDDLLAADRARNVNKAERAIEREAERALDLQIKHQNLPGACA